MSDNLTTPVPSNTVIATDDVGGIQYPRTKIAFGVDGAAADVSASAPLPVTITGGPTAAKQDELNATIATPGSAGPAKAQQLAGVGPTGTARVLSVANNGGLLPGQATCTSTRTTVNASASTPIDVARSGRVGLQFTMETAPTADVFISFSGTASATAYDLLIPSGTLKGDVSFSMFAPTTQVSAFSTAAFTINTGSWTAV